MTDVLLISEAKVRQFTDINNNVDTELIKNNIRIAQDYYLQSTIGTNLYVKLQNDVVSGSLSGYYETLLNDYAQDFILYATYYETLESIYLRPRNNGLLKPNGGENSDPADKDLYLMKRQSVENKMTYYNEKLTNYIIEEEVNFPELSNSDKLYEQIPDYTNKYRNPFVLRKSAYAEWAKKYGIRLYDSRYKQYPQ
jgi:hypothetical protein